MEKSGKTILIVVVAIAALLAIYSGWKTFGGSGRSAEARNNTATGPISSMSSMLGPDASGKPQTQRPVGPSNARPQ